MGFSRLLRAERHMTRRSSLIERTHLADFSQFASLKAGLVSRRQSRVRLPLTILACTGRFAGPKCQWADAIDVFCSV